MPEFNSEKLEKRVRKEVTAAVTDAVTKAIADAEKKKYKVEPTIDVEAKIDKDAADYVNKALKNKKYKIDLGDLFEIDTSSLRSRIQEIRKEISTLDFDASEKKEKALYNSLFLASKVAQARGVEKIALSKSKTNQVPIAEYIADLEIDAGIEEDYIKQLDEKIKNYKQAASKQVSAIIEDSKEATESIKKVNEKISETIDQANNNEKLVKIFDGFEEKTYNVNSDLDSLMRKLDELAQKMNIPAFHIGNLSQEVLNSKEYVPSDDLYESVKKKRIDSIGTGTYFSQNLTDLMEFYENSPNDKLRIYAEDLGKYSNLLRIQTEEELEDYQDMIKSISAYVLNTVESNDKFQKILKGTDSVDDLYDNYADWFNKFNVSVEKLSDFINKEIDYIKSFDDVESMVGKESINTHIGQNLFNIAGINNTKLGVSDSYAMGDLIYEIDKQHPFSIDFGSNKEIASHFYNKVLEPLLKNKVENLSEDIDALIDSYLPTNSSEETIGKYSVLLNKYRDNLLNSKTEAVDNTASISNATEETEKLIAAQEKAIENQKQFAQAASEQPDIGTAVENEKQLADAIQEATEAKKEEQALSNSSEEVDNAEKVAEAEKEKAEAIEEATEAKKEENEVSDSSEAVQDAEKETEAIKEKTAARKESIDVQKEEQSLGGNNEAIDSIEKEIQAEKEKLEIIENAVSAKKNDSSPTSKVNENLEPLVKQLDEVIERIGRKNQLFEEEKEIVASVISNEKSDLEQLATTITDIEKSLKSLAESNPSISIKGLKGIEDLTKLDVDKLDERLINALYDLQDFAKGISDLKVDDSNLITSINNLLEDGEKLKNLATIIKASKKEIQDATGATNAENLTNSYRNAINSSQRYFELRRKGSELTSEETTELERLDSIWKKLGQDLDANIQKIEKLGKNTQSAYKFMSLYNDDAGYKAYVDKAEKTAKPKSKEDFAKPYREAFKVAERYYALKLKADSLEGEELQELQKIEGEWQQLYQNITKVTQAIEEQGRSTKALESFTEMYENRTGEGVASYVEKQLKKRNLEGLSDWLDKNILASSKKSKFTDDFLNEADDLQKKLKDISIKAVVDKGSFKDVDDLIKRIKNLKDKAKTTDVKVVNPLKVSGLAEQISKYAEQYTALPKSLISELKALKKELEGGGKIDISRFNAISQSFDKIKIKAREAGVETKSFFTKIVEQIDHSNAQLIGMYVSFQDLIRYAQQMGQEVIKIDTALTELRKVSDAGTDRLGQSFRTSAESAKDLGSTIDSVINQTSDWSRLGYDIDEAENLARVTTLFQTVGDNMNTESASEYLVSTLQGFQLAADQSQSIVDKYNEVANNFAIDTAGIGEALKRSAASFNAANTDLSESIALITATNEVVQNPQSVGTLWKTMSARIRGAKTELQELGEESDKFTETTSNLRDLVKSLTGFDIMKDADTYKDIYDIVLGIGKEWKNLTDIEQASLGEALAGKRNANAFFAVMGNLETLEDAYKAAENSAGSAAKEQENYAQSIEYSLKRLSASFQELSFNLIDSGAIKAGVELLRSLLDAINAITEATDGFIPTLLAGGAAGLYVFASFTGLLKNLKEGAELFKKFGKAEIEAASESAAAKKLEAEATLEDAAATQADSAANIENSVTENGVAASKEKSAIASRDLTQAQLAETSAETADTVGNARNAITTVGAEAAKGAGGFSALGAALGSLISPVTLVVAGLGALAGVALAVHQGNEDLKQSAYELGNAFKSDAQEIAGYKEEIKDLQDKINDSSTSYDDAKKARERLLGIQDSLIEKFGDEAGKIDLVTKAIDGQIDKLDELTKKEWQRTKNEYNKSSFGKDLGLLFSGQPDNLSKMLSDWDNYKVTLMASSHEDYEFLKEMSKLYGGVFDSNEVMTSLQLSGNLDEILDKLYEMQDLSKNIDLSSGLAKQLGNEANIATDNRDKDKPMRDQWILYEEIMPNDSYYAQLKNMEKAYDKYQESKLEKDKDTANKLYESSKESILSTFKALEESGASERVIDYFRSMYPQIANEIGSWQFEIGISDAKIDEDQLISDIESFGSKKNLIDFDYSKATEEQKTAYNNIKQVADKYKITVEDIIKLLEKANKLSIPHGDESRIVAGITGARGDVYGVGRFGLNNAETENQNLTNALQRFSDSDYEDILAMGEAKWAEIAAEANKVAEETGTVTLSSEQYVEIIQKVLDKWREVPEAVEKATEPVSSSDLADELVDTYEKAFNAIGTAFNKLKENEFKLDDLDLSSITAIKKELTSLQSVLSEKGINLDISGYDELLKVVTDTSSSAAEVEAAFNSMADTVIMALDGVTQENYQVAESFLRSHGVMDASLGAFVAYANNVDNIKSASSGLVDENGRIVDSTGDAANALVSEMYTGNNTSEALKYLQLCMLSVASQGIDVSQPISALNELASTAIAAGVAVKEVTGLQNVKKAYDKAVSIHGEDSAYVKALSKVYENRQNNFRNIIEDEKKKTRDSLKIDVSKMGGSGGGSGRGKGGGGGGGGGSKKEAEEEKDILAELSKQLDEIQAAYASLTEIVAEFNENGKLTVDQAQELINTDFRYLAMLKEENGQLVLNEEGFKALAKSKLQEMQIQLARNAIDAVNNLKTEADAVNFLTYAYEGLAGAALDATEAQLQMAVAAAKARGEQQGIAAEKIYQGYLATKQAIGNTDYSQQSLSGKKEESSDKDKSEDKDKDKKKEEKKEDTKTRFNWLDRLVNKIQRTIDRLSKRAEKYFSYMEKNALVDKQLAANRRMINTQELAVDYYQNRANKALKKVPKKYRKLVSGDFDPETTKKLVSDLGSSKTKRVQDYLEWQSLLEKSQDALQDAYDAERELIGNKLDNILNYFDTLIGYQQNIIDKLDASMKVDAAKGLPTDINKLISQYASQKSIVDESKEREEAYEKEAADQNEQIRKSYEGQIDETAKGYQDTTSYQKLKNKGKQGKAKKALNEQYQVLAEDIDEYLTAFKNLKKKKKKAEAQATIDRLHKKYTDYLDELRREEEEALAANEKKLIDQKNQNEKETLEAEAERWNKVIEILESMGAIYDTQIKQLDTMISQYESIVDLLQNVKPGTLAKYGVQELLGVDDTDPKAVSKVLEKAIGDTKEKISGLKLKYSVYQDIIKAMEANPGEREQLFKAILERNNLDEESKKAIEDLVKDLSENNWSIDNTRLADFKDLSAGVIEEIIKSIKQAENYSKELTDSITESTQKIIDSLRLLQEAYAAKASLVNDSWITDLNGMTDYGYAKVSALAQEMQIARKRAELYATQVSDIAKAGVSSYDSEDAFNEAYNTAIKNYYSALQDAYSTQNEIYEIAKKAAQTEVNNISTLVENYKKALNAKKAYYDYDKQLREKNKNIQSLQSQIEALNGVNDAASKARLKALQAELKEAQEDLDDTVFEHQIQVETDALDKLIEDMTKALEESAKTIQETFENFTETITSIVNESNRHDNDSTYKKLIDFISGGKSSPTTTAPKGTVGNGGVPTGSSGAKTGEYDDISKITDYSKVNKDIIDIIVNQNNMIKNQVEMLNNNRYIPTMSNSLTYATRNLEDLIKSNRVIENELSNQTNLLSKINDGIMMNPNMKVNVGGRDVTLTKMLKDFEKMGLIRIYH